jgi:glycosyltransferase involved in cell wall biosynthesis
VGRLVPKKGYDIAYDAQSDDYFTLIVGEGVRPARIASNRNVRLFGAANQNELRDLYALSDVFVFPATGEIFTLVMQEAMASGLPVVTTNDPGYEPYEFSRELVRLVERESGALRVALQQIIADTPQQEAMGAYAREFALDQFDWERNYEQEYRIYGLQAKEAGL